MIGLRNDLKVLVSSRPIDFRRGVHGLVAMVAEALYQVLKCRTHGPISGVQST